MKYVIILAALLISLPGWGQTYQMPVRSNFKLLILNLNGLIRVDGTYADSIKITQLSEESQKDLSSSADRIFPDDNTGIGLHIDCSKPITTIEPAHEAAQWQDYSFTIPRNSLIRISNYEAQSFPDPDLYLSKDSVKGIFVENLSGEIEVGTWHSPVHLDSITGPATIHTVDGDIWVNYLDLSKEGIHSYESVSGDIRLLVPKKSGYRHLIRNTSTGEPMRSSRKNPRKFVPANSKEGAQIITGSINGWINLSERHKQ